MMYGNTGNWTPLFSNSFLSYVSRLGGRGRGEGGGEGEGEGGGRNI
jgi:hypothetical protein